MGSLSICGVDGNITSRVSEERLFLHARHILTHHGEVSSTMDNTQHVTHSVFSGLAPKDVMPLVHDIRAIRGSLGAIRSKVQRAQWMAPKCHFSYI